MLVARALGEVARRFGLPTVLGEIAAGVLLGKTVLARVAPAAFDRLFPSTGAAPIVLDGLGQIAIALFLLVAGMEVDLSTMRRRGRTAIAVAGAGMLVPFALGFGAARVFADALEVGSPLRGDAFAAFFGIASSISALPVIARILMDLHIYRSDFGMTIVAAAIVNDLVGWVAFAALLMSLDGEHAGGWVTTAGLAVGFTVVMLTVVRAAIHRALPWVLAYAHWPTGILAASLGVTLLSAAATQALGIHALFGAFLAGVALGDSTHMREHTKATIADFVHSFFAPLFFGAIALQLDLVRHFDGVMCAVVLAVACVGKIGGCGLAARLCGTPVREAVAIGAALNARGSMEIVLGLVALQAGIIGEALFVALILMALATSLLSGPLIVRVLRLRAPRRVRDFVSSRAFVPRLRATTATEAIEELAALAAASSKCDARAIAADARDREAMASTGVDGGVAVPHGRDPSLKAPIVAVGVSSAGIDFNAPDGEPAQLVFLVLTPATDDGAQLELLAELGRRFEDPITRRKAFDARSYVEFKALLESGG
ncbi:MAG: cation:proton antiporter [Planctomycetes bacterium]|nr:cation:proton antiporter [Planctomycetota bacterium]MCC7172051.1 cation:proton antiporter [Planctomycetota bacterium]